MQLLRTKYKEVPLWPLYVLLFTSVDTLLFGTNSNKSFLYIPRLIALLSFVILPTITKRYKEEKNSLIVTILLLIVVSLSVMTNGSVSSIYISRICFIGAAYTIVKCYKLEEFLVAFEDFIVFVSTIALVTFAISYVVPSIFGLFYQMTNEVGFSYSSFFFGSIQYQELENTLKRMNAIFWEPGAFAIYICIGLIFHLFLRNTIDRKKLAVLLLSLVVTFSTTGIICSGVILFTYAISKDSINGSLKTLLGLVVILMLGLYISGLADAIIELLFGKIVNGEHTTTVRESSFINGWQIALDYPILGVGGNSGEYISEYASKSGYGYNTMLTNTWTFQFANYGFFFGILFTIGSYRFFKKFSTSGFQALMLFTSLMLLYVGECFYSFLPFLFVLYGFGKSNINLKY